jgi:hypothetical protein
VPEGIKWFVSTTGGHKVGNFARELLLPTLYLNVLCFSSFFKLFSQKNDVATDQTPFKWQNIKLHPQYYDLFQTYKVVQFVV